MNGITTYQNLATQYLSSKDVQRDAGAKTDRGTGKVEEKNAVQTREDGVELSAEARRGAEVYGMTKQLKEIPDPREEKVRDIMGRLQNGSLLNEATVRSSIKRMLASGVPF